MRRSIFLNVAGVCALTGCVTTTPPVTVSPAPPPVTVDTPPQPEAPDVTPTVAVPTDAKGPCKFDRVTLSFSGTPSEQAKCLLMPARRWGELGTAVTALPTPLDQVGAVPPINHEQMRAYLAAQSIDEMDLGGSLDAPLSTTSGGFKATYFVIHDTSTPNYLLDDFPSDINQPTWQHNDLTRWTNADRKVAHVFTNRSGQSATTVDFSTGWRATKLELNFGRADSRGRFLHVENIQPRRSLASAFPGNDALAPTPGFPDAQYRRLALVYLAASIRAGEMLIPAFHTVLDNGFENAHDDPQNFDLDLWARMLTEEIAAIDLNN